ncbi:MAG TPA: hypothetical protein VFH06_05355 [Candidatus Saccharimonadales bacterium]|nr:hypothetical protein [Candidatus Saccharimonadales bacterium]
MSETKKPYIEITPYDAKQFFETPDSVVEAKRDALYGEGALGRFAVNAIAKRGGLVGVVFAPDDKGIRHPARIVNLGKDFGTPVHIDYNKPFDAQYEPLDTAAKEEEQAENMAADTMVIKRDEIETLDTPAELDEGEPTQTVDMKNILDEGRDSEVVSPTELAEEVAPESDEAFEGAASNKDLISEIEAEPVTGAKKEPTPEIPWRQLSLAERLAGATEPQEKEADPQEELEASAEEQREIEKLELQDMEVAEAVSKVIEHTTEQLDNMSKETVELATRFDETYPNAYRIGHTIEQSGVLPVLDDMKKTFGEHDARIVDMQAETARYVKTEESVRRQEQTEERSTKQAFRQEALETIEKLSEQLSKMEEANSGMLEIQRSLDSMLRDHAQLIYYPDVSVFRGAAEMTGDTVKQFTERLSARGESGKRIRSLIEELTEIQGKLQAEE